MVALAGLLLLVPQAWGGMIDLVAKAEVENVGRIGVPADHTFFLKLTCPTCRSEFPNAVGVSSDMVVEGIKGACTPFLARPAPLAPHTAPRTGCPPGRLRGAARCLGRAPSRTDPGRARAGRGVGERADEVQRM